MNSILIPAVKQIIRSISISEAEKLVEPLLHLDTSEEIERALDKINSKLGLQ
jgi:phosphoenolpyruvate-protein kinase (PTS system EI component)